MKRRIHHWIAFALSGMLVAAAPLAQAGDKHSGAGMQHEMGDKKAGDKHVERMKDRRADQRQDRESGRLSGAGTEAAGGSAWHAEMSRCTSMTDRRERAECAREALERQGPAS